MHPSTHLPKSDDAHLVPAVVVLQAQGVAHTHLALCLWVAHCCCDAEELQRQLGIHLTAPSVL